MVTIGDHGKSNRWALGTQGAMTAACMVDCTTWLSMVFWFQNFNKCFWDLLHEADFEAHLRDAGVDNVTGNGVQTDVGML